jgi:thiaminase
MMRLSECPADIAALIEQQVLLQSPSKVIELLEIFRRVTEYEALFWTSALAAGNETQIV